MASRPCAVRNVQGSCDMGMLPNLYPGYQKVTDPAVRAKFAKAWGVPEEKLPLEEGYELDLGHLVDEGKVHCFYNYGEGPPRPSPIRPECARRSSSWICSFARTSL